MICTYLIRPRDPILVRDGRPFTADPGALARSLDWPLPSTVAGALRTHIGGLNGFDWSGDGPDRAMAVEALGPLMVASWEDDCWEVCAHAPADAVVCRKEDGPQDAGTPLVLRLSPRNLPDDAGCNLPQGILPLNMPEELKSASGYDFWPLDSIVRWLAGENVEPPSRPVPRLPRDTRIHVRMSRDTGAHEEGGLFATQSLCMPDVAVDKCAVPRIAMLCRLQGDVDDAGSGPTFIPFGGERRFSALERDTVEWPACPDTLKKAAAGRRLKLQLITPGIFARGWMPAWADAGRIPNSGGAGVARLVSAAVPRRAPVSGWDYARRRPRAARFMCPAGSVFFLELEDDASPELFERLWLASICDDDQCNKDGFGIAVPGVWDYSNEVVN